MSYDPEAIAAMIKAEDPNLEALLALLAKRGRRVISVEALVKAINSIATQPRDGGFESDASRLRLIADQMENYAQRGDLADLAIDDLRAIAGRLLDLR